MPDHDHDQPFDRPGDVSVEEGVILVDGPDGVAIALTPRAARVFGELLIAAAKTAGA